MVRRYFPFVGGTCTRHPSSNDVPPKEGGSSYLLGQWWVERERERERDD